uniref:Uncharacterized protein n=1 Tax=Homalodisca liturata TaxID=320908 RepID=A0A1B6IE96_9HEMI
MPCPFLSRLPSAYVRNYGLNLLKSFGSHCPVVSRLATSIPNDPNPSEYAETPASRCPFLAEVSSPIVKEASQELQGDIIEFTSKTTEEGDERDVGAKTSQAVSPKSASQQIQENKFPYEDFFHEQIMRKKTGPLVQGVQKGRSVGFRIPDCTGIHLGRTTYYCLVCQRLLRHVVSSCRQTGCQRCC